MIDWIIWLLLEQHVIHLIIIRLESYSQRCVTVNVFPLYLFRVVFQDKLKNSVLLLIAVVAVFNHLNNSYITKTHGKVERSISSAIDMIVCSSVV